MEMLLVRTKASIYTGMGRYKEAIETIHKAFALADNEITRTDLTGYMADIYYMAGDHDAAERYYREILNSGFTYHNRAVSVCNYMSMLNSERRYIESLEVYEKNKERISFCVNDHTAANLITNQAVALAGIGDYAGGYEFMSKANALRDSISASVLSGDHLAIYELWKQSEKKDAALRQVTRLRILLWIGLALFISACCGGAWFFHKWHHAKKTSDGLRQQFNLIEQTHHEEIEQKDTRISSQYRELTSHALQLAQMTELTNEILALTERKGEADSLRLRKIRDLIRSQGFQNNMWEIFKTYFEGTHPAFFRNLYSRHPDLSANEVRMCAYIMLNLTTKEIAALTNRSVRTIDTIKYRLHKKLGLTDESTAAYLSRIPDS